MAALLITAEETATGLAYKTEARGVSYYLRRDTLNRWELSSQRNALRASRMGGTVRHFNNLAELETAVKAFDGIAALIEG